MRFTEKILIPNRRIQTDGFSIKSQFQSVGENGVNRINTFWNYFKKNEQEIVYAILLGINTEEVFFQFEKNSLAFQKELATS